MSIDQCTTEIRDIGGPPITLTTDDFERLAAIVQAKAYQDSDVTSVLTQELARADVLTTKRLARIVGMNSEVEFRDDTTGRVQCVRLVYPADADISQRHISVLTPIGTALIGVRVGDSITWKMRNGAIRQLTVLDVREPISGGVST